MTNRTLVFVGGVFLGWGVVVLLFLLLFQYTRHYNFLIYSDHHDITEIVLKVALTAI